MSDSKKITPRLSVLVPTYNRPDLVESLLTNLRDQTLAPSDFELIMIDDGSEVPVAIEMSDFRFPITLLRQPNAGPGAARNAGLEFCRAPLTLILNDDAVLAQDLLEQHLAAHAKCGEKIAVLGTFTFTEEALKSPFTQVLAQSDLLFNFPRLVDGEIFDWSFFWTCNLSLPTKDLLAVGGFDAERFDRAIVEDVELGYRLQALGYQVLHVASARCEHAHALSPEGYFKRGVDLGVYLARMYVKHSDPAILWCATGREGMDNHLSSMQSTYEAYWATAQRLVEKLQVQEKEKWGQKLSDPVRLQLEAMIRKLSFVPFCRGALIELTQHDPEPISVNGPTKHQLTSIIVVSHNAIEQTTRCLAALRSASEVDHPAELVFIDNGSTDGTVEFLSAQDDVRLILNSVNIGAPAARNQGITESTGERLVFMDNDVMVTPGWLPRMLFQNEIDVRAGCTGCLSDRAAHKQQIEYTGDGSSTDLRRFADSRAQEHPRSFRRQTLLTSFLIMVPRTLIETIGGFDEAFSPWGFEDDDFSLRAYLAGFSNRVALDVFVRHEAYSGTRKQKVHTDLLTRNWKRFAEKWGLPRNTAYGDLEALAEIQPGQVPNAALFVPVNSPSEPGSHVLAWPDYQDVEGLRELFANVAHELINQEERQLVLRVLPRLDGSVEEVLRVVEQVYSQVFSEQQHLSVTILDEVDPHLAATKAQELCATINPIGSRRKRAKWLRKTGLPQTTFTT